MKKTENISIRFNPFNERNPNLTTFDASTLPFNPLAFKGPLRGCLNLVLFNHIWESNISLLNEITFSCIYTTKRYDTIIYIDSVWGVDRLHKSQINHILELMDFISHEILNETIRRYEVRRIPPKVVLTDLNIYISELLM